MFVMHMFVKVRKVGFEKDCATARFILRDVASMVEAPTRTGMVGARQWTGVRWDDAIGLRAV